MRVDPSALISPAYRALNAELHRNNEGYGARGHRWAVRVAEIAGVIDARTILDYGCGKGSLGKALRLYGFEVRDYDPAIPGLDALPERADLVVCTDVLEHVEPERLDTVLTHIVSLAGKGCLLVASTKAGSKRLPDGRRSHLIVQPASWWAEKFRRYGAFAPEPPAKSGDYAALWCR